MEGQRGRKSKTGTEAGIVTTCNEQMIGRYIKQTNNTYIGQTEDTCIKEHVKPMLLILKLNQSVQCEKGKLHRTLLEISPNSLCSFDLFRAPFLVFQSAHRPYGRVFYQPSRIKPQAAASSKGIHRIPLCTTCKAKNARELRESK